MTDKKVKPPPQLVRGMRDILPEDEATWRWVSKKIESHAAQFGYTRIATPLIEEAQLFVRSVGEASDIVAKEMYTFTTKEGGALLALRPEGTAAVARAYITHGMHNRPQPVREWYQGPMFRHDRPQAGRYREFTHAGFEVLGDEHPTVDAELILIASTLCDALGIEARIEVSSVGHPECRAVYAKLLKEFTRDKKAGLCKDCVVRREHNPLRMLDCKEASCQALMGDAPLMVDHLCEPDKAHFVHVLEYLDEAGVPYTLNPRIVRGLDYYTHTTFEIFQESGNQGDQRASSLALGGGGRYNMLVEELGGRPTPAAGFAMGVDRILEALTKETKEEIASTAHRPDVFIAQLGDGARKRAFVLMRELVASGIRIATRMSKDGLKGQFEAANKEGARFVFIIGQKEVSDGTVLLRDMTSGVQELFPFSKVVAEVKRRLASPIA